MIGRFKRLAGAIPWKKWRSFVLAGISGAFFVCTTGDFLSQFVVANAEPAAPPIGGIANQNGNGNAASQGQSGGSTIGTQNNYNGPVTITPAPSKPKKHRSKTSSNATKQTGCPRLERGDSSTVLVQGGVVMGMTDTIAGNSWRAHELEFHCANAMDLHVNDQSNPGERSSFHLGSAVSQRSFDALPKTVVAPGVMYIDHLQTSDMGDKLFLGRANIVVDPTADVESLVIAVPKTQSLGIDVQDDTGAFLAEGGESDSYFWKVIRSPHGAYLLGIHKPTKDAHVDVRVWPNLISPP